MVAYAPDTGERLWASITEKVAYATPTPSTLLGQKQLLVFSASHLIGIDEQTGKELWRFPWNVKYDNSIAQPVAISDHQVFISGGYGKGCALLEFSREGERWKADRVWKNAFHEETSSPARCSMTVASTDWTPKSHSSCAWNRKYRPQAVEGRSLRIRTDHPDARPHNRAMQQR